MIRSPNDPVPHDPVLNDPEYIYTRLSFCILVYFKKLMCCSIIIMRKIRDTYLYRPINYPPLLTHMGLTSNVDLWGPNSLLSSSAVHGRLKYVNEPRGERIGQG
jgi:hypothetical protein